MTGSGDPNHPGANRGFCARPVFGLAVPGSAGPRVGGEQSGALIVRVRARAVDGKATEAGLTAVADSFGGRFGSGSGDEWDIVIAA